MSSYDKTSDRDLDSRVMSRLGVWKNDSNKWLTKALFYETTLPATRDNAVFTLKNEDIEVDGVEYWSLRKRFVECDDPTEYEFANKWLGGWAHWKELCKCEALKDDIADWREERDVRLRSMGVKKLVSLASGEDSSFQAAKWLADRGWQDTPSKRGRPTNADVKKAAREKAEVSKRVSDDMKRLKALGS